MGSTAYPETDIFTSRVLVSTTSLNGNLSTSVNLPAGYSRFEFVQYSTGTTGITNFTYRFNNNSSSVYANGSSYADSINAFGYVHPSYSPSVMNFSVNMPDLVSAHASEFDWISLGSVTESYNLKSGTSSVAAITSVQVLADTANHTGTLYTYGVK